MATTGQVRAAAATTTTTTNKTIFLFAMRPAGFLCGKCPDEKYIDLTFSACVKCEGWHGGLLAVFSEYAHIIAEQHYVLAHKKIT